MSGREDVEALNMDDRELMRTLIRGAKNFGIDLRFQPQVFEAFRKSLSALVQEERAAAASEVLRLCGTMEQVAIEMSADCITSGSLGPLMNAGYGLACKHWAERLRAALAHPQET